MIDPKIEFDPREVAEMIAAELVRTQLSERIHLALKECTEGNYGRNEVADTVRLAVRKATEQHIAENFQEQIKARVAELVTPLLVEQSTQAIVNGMVKKLFKD